MPQGAAWQFNEQLDGANLDDPRVNSLDSGCNTYHENNAGLNVAVTAGRITTSLGYVDFAGVSGQAMPASTVGRALWVDTAGAFQQGAAFPGGEHYPLAEVDTNGTDVIAIRDMRPKAGVTNIPSGAPTGPAGGDLASTYPNPTVATVGGETAANIASHVASVANPHGVTAAQAGAVALAAVGAAGGVASLNGSSLVVEEPASKAAAGGIASLNGSSLVVQNPASATATPAAAAIPIADGNGKLDDWVTQQPTSLAPLYVPSGDPSVPGTRLLYPKAVAFAGGGTVQYMQVFLPAGVTIDNLETFLDSGGASGESIRLGLYDQASPTDPFGTPDTKLDETAARVLNGGDDGTFVVEALGAPVAIPSDGFYWIALICSGTNSVFAGSETIRAGFAARREETSAGVTLPASAGVLTNPASAGIYSAARRS